MKTSEIKDKLEKLYSKVDESIYCPTAIDEIINEIKWYVDLLLDKLE